MVNLGDKVKDKVTGFTGIAISLTSYLQGCVRVCVQPQELVSGKPVESIFFDGPQLIIVEKNCIVGNKKENDNGGVAYLVDKGKKVESNRTI